MIYAAYPCRVVLKLVFERLSYYVPVIKEKNRKLLKLLLAAETVFNMFNSLQSFIHVEFLFSS